MSQEPNQERSSTQAQIQNKEEKVEKTEDNNQLQIARTQLKQKIKQNKVLVTKNSKLQTKYVELFREHKLFKKDHANLVLVIKHIFPDYLQKPLGSYDSEELIEKLIIKESLSSQKIKQMIQEASYEKSELERKIKEEMEQKIKNVDNQSKTYLDDLNKQLDSFKKNNKTLSQQMIDLDKKLDSKNSEISKLMKEKLKLEHQVNQLKLKEITSELDDTKKSDNQKNNSDRNQLLALKQQIDALLDKRDSLRKELKISKQQISLLQSQMQQKDKKIIKIQEQMKLVLEKCQKVQPIAKNEKQQKQEQVVVQPNELNEPKETYNYQHLQTDEEYVHREYMKNIFIRYMKCYGNADYTQAEILLNILLTILKFSINEREQILVKKRGWFGLY